MVNGNGMDNKLRRRWIQRILIEKGTVGKLVPNNLSHAIRWIHFAKVVTSDERTGSWKDTPNFYLACEAKKSINA